MIVFMISTLVMTKFKAEKSQNKLENQDTGPCSGWFLCPIGHFGAFFFGWLKKIDFFSKRLENEATSKEALECLSKSMLFGFFQRFVSELWPFFGQFWPLGGGHFGLFWGSKN